MDVISTVTVSNLIVPTLGLCILAVMADRLIRVLQEIMYRIPKLPDEFWSPITYILAFIIALVVCWRSNFNYFSYYGCFKFSSFEGYMVTSLFISGGTKIVKESFGLMGFMPSIMSGFSNYFGGSSADTNIITDPTIVTPNVSTDPTVPESNEAGIL